MPKKKNDDEARSSAARHDGIVSHTPDRNVAADGARETVASIFHLYR